MLHLTLRPSKETLETSSLCFYPKNTTPQLQPCEAGIIRNFETCYFKFDDGKKASEIIQGVDLLQCMRWVNQGFEQITKDTI